MKGAYLLSLVLLIVLAIPLFADQTLVNTVGEFSAISTMNKKKEIPFSERELAYDHIAVLNVGIRKSYLYTMTGSCHFVPLEKNVIAIHSTIKKYFGGVRRVKLGRH